MRAFSTRTAGPGAGPALYLVGARVAALACVLALKASFAPRAYQSLLFAVALAHYGLGLGYSRSLLVERLAEPRARLRLAALAAAGAVSAAFLWRGTWLLFGAHMALSDAFLLERAEGRADPAVGTARLAFNLAAYLAVALAGFGSPLARLAAWAALGAALWTAAALRRARATPAEALRALAFESFWPLLLAGAALLRLDLHNLDLVFYHGLVWVAAPLPDLAAERGSVPRYAAATALSVALLLLLTPVAGLGWALAGRSMYKAVNLSGNLHILLSLALSRLNPGEVVAFFAPARRPALEAA